MVRALPRCDKIFCLRAKRYARLGRNAHGRMARLARNIGVGFGGRALVDGPKNLIVLNMKTKIKGLEPDDNPSAF